MTQARRYKNLDTFVKAMRKDKIKKLWADWFNISGHWYVVEEYDWSGKYMRLTSLTAKKHIDLNTSNRYSNDWLSDLEAEEYEAENYRFDWRYYMDEEELKKLEGQALNNMIKYLSNNFNL